MENLRQMFKIKKKNESCFNDDLIFFYKNKKKY